MLDQTRIRLDAINHVLGLREKWVAVPGSELLRFNSAGKRIVLRSAQGIFKPKELSEPLSIQSTATSRYSDDLVDGRKVRYHYLPRSREHENDGLKRCAAHGLPLIFFLQVKPKPGAEYEIFAPVYISGWDDPAREFLIDLSGSSEPPPRANLPGLQLTLPNIPAPESAQELRELGGVYLVHPVQRRICHARFRRLILKIYGDRCAVCLLNVRPLLDAAYIGTDLVARTGAEPREGIALCSIHLRAFHAGFLSWDEAYIVHIHLHRRAVGEGERALLMPFDGKPLALPRDERNWPRRTGP